MNTGSADRIAGIIFLVILFAAGISLSAGNILIHIRSSRGEKTPSPAPFIGGVLISIALLILTGTSHPWKFIIPFVTDSTIPMIILALRNEFFTPPQNK